MRAIIAKDQQPTFVHLPEPVPAADEVLVQVKATALNRADLLQVMGKYPPPPGAPHTLGLELAGDVISVGEEVQNVSVGQRVMALVAGGAYAEQAVVKAAHVIPIPSGLTYEEAAAIPEAFLTAYSNMIEIGRLIENERVLIHAGASGVGLAAIQMAKVVGATVIVTASRAKHAICVDAGADMTIDYQTENFADRILSTYTGVHLILEMIGAPYWDDNMRVLENWGRLVFIGLQGGAVKQIHFGVIMQKRLSIMGSTLRNRTDAEKQQLIENFTSWAMPQFLAGALKPNVWRVMPFDDVAAAHDLMRRNQNA
ncbi:MAG: NAD(P)H-quinone oxidoreductase, partial [Chloroflexi bacterium]